MRQSAPTTTEQELAREPTYHSRRHVGIECRCRAQLVPQSAGDHHAAKDNRRGARCHPGVHQRHRRAAHVLHAAPRPYPRRRRPEQAQARARTDKRVRSHRGLGATLRPGRTSARPALFCLAPHALFFSESPSGATNVINQKTQLSQPGFLAHIKLSTLCFTDITPEVVGCSHELFEFLFFAVLLADCFRLLNLI